MRKPDHLERTMDFGACDLVEEAAQVERREPGRILMFAHGGDMAALLQMEIICRRRPQRLDLALERLAALTAFVGRNIDARSGLQGKVMIKQIAHGSWGPRPGTSEHNMRI